MLSTLAPEARIARTPECAPIQTAETGILRGSSKWHPICHRASGMFDQAQFRVLIIEDDRTDREIYKRCLNLERTCHFEFAEAESAAGGIEMARTWRPDCILVDYSLPDMDGLQLLNHLKFQGQSFPCAVVMLTAYGGEALAVHAMKAGVLDYLPKRDANAHYLPHAISNAIERFRMQCQIEEQRAALERSARQYQLLLEAMPQMVWTANADGLLEYANGRWIEYTGLSAQGVRRLGWDETLYPDDQEGTWAFWRQSAQTGAVFEIEHRLKRASDRTYRWHLVRAVPMRNAEGQITHWFGTCTEIEDQKQAEKAALQRQKFESIGRLAGGIAHDFNNLLVTVLGGTSLAIDSLPTPHPARSLLKEVVVAGEQAAQLTGRMLAYAGKANFFVESANINRLVQDACERAKASLPPCVRLEICGGDSLPPIETDVEQMRQAIRELVVNAAEAIGLNTPGTIRIRTTGVEIAGSPAETASGLPEIPAGTYVAVEVTDTGRGMDEEVQKKIFDPFFSTKSLGRGLGLAAVQGFVRSNRGAIRVHSAPGAGTWLQVLLPTAWNPERAPKEAELSR